MCFKKKSGQAAATTTTSGSGMVADDTGELVPSTSPGGGSTTTTTSGTTSGTTTGAGGTKVEKTTDQFYEEMKPGPFELPSLLTGSTPVSRSPISYGGVIPTQRAGSKQRSLLVPFIRPMFGVSSWRPSS
jgi:hypothetical protein